MPPNKVRPVRNDTGELTYAVNTTNGNFYLNNNEVLHIKGLGFDGIQGYNVIQFANQSLGNAKAADKFAGTFFS